MPILTFRGLDAGCRFASAALLFVVAGEPCAASEPPAPYEIVVAASGVQGRGLRLQEGRRQSLFVTTDSLPGALALARAHRQSAGQGRQIVITLRSGIHRLTAPVRIGPDLSGTEGRPLVIQGPRDGDAIISGAVVLTPLARMPQMDALSRIPRSVRSRLRAFRLPGPLAGAPRVASARRDHHAEIAPVPFEIFDAQGVLRAARWPNEGWARGGRHSGDGARVLELPTGSARAWTWASEPDMWLEGYLRWDWSYTASPVTEVRPGPAGSLRLSPADDPPFGIGDRPRIAVSHAAAELDRPGEWYRDRRSGYLLVLPRAGGEARLEASLAPHLFVIEGARHVRIRNVALEKSRSDLVRVTRSRDIKIADATLRWSGGRAAVFAQSEDSGVSRCRISDTGEGGVSLSGGARSTLSAAHLFVVDSVIRRFSRTGRTYKPAVALAGIGQIAAGNLISDAPHIAISFEGNDHLIDRNEITRVVLDTSDAGAIYTGRDWSARGTRITGNFLHDIRARSGAEIKGVYLDDMASGITVARNLFLRVDQPVFIGGGRDNRVEGNVFLSASPAITLDARGLTWAAASVSDPASEIRRALQKVPYRSPVWQRRYPRLAMLLLDEPARPKGNVFRHNVFAFAGGYEFVAGVDRTLVVAGPDVMLRAGEQRDGLLQSRSARQVGTLVQRSLRLGGGTGGSAVQWGAGVPWREMDRARALGARR